MTSSATIHRQQVDRIKSAFFKSFRPPTDFEDTAETIRMAHEAISNTAKPEAARCAEAVRLLACIPAFREAIPDEAMNAIFAKDSALRHP